MLQKIEAAVNYIKSKSTLSPRFGVVLGSGLGAFVKEIEVDASIPFNEIPNFAPTTVEGHSGSLILGRVNKSPIAALSGRIHFYEGHDIEQVVFPIRVLGKLGIKQLLITNSSGGLDAKMTPGELMIIEDHINIAGRNPLIGKNFAELGPRFPDMTEAYSRRLSEKLETALKKNAAPYSKGIYCYVTGPSYETPAEVRFLGGVGGRAVGMSTVPEVIAANHMGLEVCGLSCITNLAAGLSKHKLTHEEVTTTAKNAEILFSAVIKDFIQIAHS